MADGTVEQHGRNGAVDTTAEAQYDFVAADLGTEFSHGSLNEALWRPLLTATTDSDDEVAQQRNAVDGVVYLRVELYGIGRLTLNLVAGILHMVG